MAQLQLIVLTIVAGVALCAVQGLNVPRHRHGHPHNVTNVRRNSTDAVVGHVNLATNLTGFANGSLPFLFDHRWNMTGSDAHRANATLRDTAVTSHNHTDETSLRRGHGHPHNVTNARRNATDAVIGHVNLDANLTGFGNGSLESLFGRHWNTTGVNAHRANTTLRDTTDARHNLTNDISALAGNVTNLLRHNYTIVGLAYLHNATILGEAFIRGNHSERRANVTDVLRSNVTSLHELADAHHLGNGTVLVSIDRRANYTEDGFQRRHQHSNSTNFHAYNASRIQPHDWNITAFGQEGGVKFNATGQLPDVDLRGHRHPHPRNATEAH
ncbi:hypothetical protein AAVH_29770 [Aphelenchoides avenae]|nr:hypothetical protein AAVH_29770 [Aphelenchus avenae]